MSARPLVAVFAGVDGTGGAGLIADTRAIACGGGQALTITTAVTAQNLNGVKACWPLPTARVRTQFSTLCATSVDAIKIGVCGNAASVIIESIRHWRAPTVWDPVLSPTAGTAFISPTQRVQLVRRLLPHTCVITPNRQELTELSERRQVIDGVAVLLDAGARHVLITDCKKGATVHHALYGNNRQLLWETATKRRPGNYHGSGCFFSSLLATRLAFDDTPAQAADTAHQRTLEAIDNAFSVPTLGKQKLLSLAP